MGGGDKTMRLINLTPHTIVVDDGDGERIHVEPSGLVVRLVEEDETITTHPFPIVKRTYKLGDFPSPEVIKGLDGTVLPAYPDTITIALVSLPVLLAMPADALSFLINHNIIVAAPDTGKGAIRDEKGQVIAVRGLVTK
jgi:hypothetical protein